MKSMEKNEVKKIGIIGAGVMGTGVAQRFATYGYDVLLIDVDSKRLLNLEPSLLILINIISQKFSFCIFINIFPKNS